MEETVGGFIVGSILGVIVGVALGRSRLLSDVLGPYIKGANAIPRVVVGALFAISLGLDIKSKIATAAVLVFFVVFFNAFQGVREVADLIANARILGANDRHLTTEIIIPSAMSWIIASLHTSFGLALVGAVVGELFGATQGVGELIYSAKNLFDAAGVFAGMGLLAAMALVAEALITALRGPSDHVAPAGRHRDKDLKEERRMRFRTQRLFTALAALAMLAACGGTSTPGTTSSGVDVAEANGGGVTSRSICRTCWPSSLGTSRNRT